MTRYFDWRLTLAVLTPLILAALGSLAHAETIEIDRAQLEQIDADLSYAIGFYKAHVTQLEKAQANVREALLPATKPQLPEVSVPPVAGFTVFTKSADTRTIYVSSSEGDDSNSGLSPDDPVKTPERGYDLLRDGHPDWLLLRAGDRFRELPAWLKSGRSRADRMLVGVYGPADAPRPTFSRRLVGVFWRPSHGDLMVRHVAFVGLHARPAPGSDADTGIRWLMPSEDILFEDCKIEGYRNNIVFQRGGSGAGEYSLRDIHLRRCIIIDSISDGKGQGIYAHGIDGLLIEQSIFDRNGRNPGSHDKFNHNLYIARQNSDVRIRGNISSRAASHGLQMRPGGLIEGNLFAFNPIGFFTTRANSIVRGNVVLFGSDMPGGGARGWGIQIGTGDSDLAYALVEGNTIAWNRGSQQRAGIEVSSKVKCVDLLDNIVHDWHRSSGEGIDVKPEQVDVMKGNRTVRNSLTVDPKAVEANTLELIERERSRPRGEWYRAPDWSAREVLE